MAGGLTLRIQNLEDFADFYRISKIFIHETIRSPTSTGSSSKAFSRNILLKAGFDDPQNFTIIENKSPYRMKLIKMQYSQLFW